MNKKPRNIRPIVNDSLIVPSEITQNAQETCTHFISAKNESFQVPRDSKSIKQGHVNIENCRPKVAIGDSNLRDCGSRLNNIQVHDTAMVYPGTKMCNMAFRIQDMDAKDDADIIAINLGTNDALNATVEGHALLGVKSVIDKVKNNLYKPLIICSVPPMRNKYTNSTRCMINDYL